MNMANTPFVEYREEQLKVNIFDYFVEPSFFDRFCDTKPIIISGSRGTGKTTILKVLSLAETKNLKEYLEKNNYIGIYYRIDLNVTTSFQGDFLKDIEWEKLFSYYFVAKLSYGLIGQFTKWKNELNVEDEKALCQKYAKLFAKRNDVYNFEDLKALIFDELYNIRDYINNCAYQKYPHIGDYQTIIRELPEDLLASRSSFQLSEKTVFYLIDEFEGLFEWQQKLVLSFVKYADKYHTYKICVRPDGIKSAQTVGNEYVRETDDLRTINLNELILENRNDYYKYALDVCKKRMDVFYKKNNLENQVQVDFISLFEELEEDEEFKIIFDKKDLEFRKDIEQFLKEVHVSDTEVKEFFLNNYFDFLIFRLMYWKNNQKQSFSEIFQNVKTKNSKYTDAVGNYKYALLYYLCLRFSITKCYSGFNALVNISGGTLRYLLELCNEIFERAVSSGFDYNNPHVISYKTQTNAVISVSSKRVNQISAIPQIGLNMRTFVISLGKIYRIYHRDERLAKFETNHFSIKTSVADIDGNISLFLKECVMRGVLLKKKNNKNKGAHKISLDEYIYMLNPIYTPSFQISWRSKQKTEFDLSEIKILIGSDSKKINHIIRKYEEKYLKTRKEDVSVWNYVQMELSLEEDG